MYANFTPELGVRINPTNFRFWCQKVLPLVYDDSLSYYELLCKVVNYLNSVIADVATLGGDVDNLLTAYKQLQDFVNTYFDNLDIKQELIEILGEDAINLVARTKALEENAKKTTAWGNTLVPTVAFNVGMKFDKIGDTTLNTLSIYAPNDDTAAIYYPTNGANGSWNVKQLINILASTCTITRGVNNALHITIPARTVLCFDVNNGTLKILNPENCRTWDGMYIPLVQRSGGKIVGGAWFDRYGDRYDIDVINNTLKEHKSSIDTNSKNIGNLTTNLGNTNKSIAQLDTKVENYQLGNNNRMSAIEQSNHAEHEAISEEIGDNTALIEKNRVETAMILPVLLGDNPRLYYDKANEKCKIVFETPDKTVRIFNKFLEYRDCDDTDLQFGDLSIGWNLNEGDVYTFYFTLKKSCVLSFKILDEHAITGKFYYAESTSTPDEIRKAVLIVDNNGNIVGGSWYPYFINGVVTDEYKNTTNAISTVRNMATLNADLNSRTQECLVDAPVPCRVNNETGDKTSCKNGDLTVYRFGGFRIAVKLNVVEGYTHHIVGDDGYDREISSPGGVFSVSTGDPATDYECQLNDGEFVVWNFETQSLERVNFDNSEIGVFEENHYPVFGNRHGWLVGAWASFVEYEN